MGRSRKYKSPVKARTVKRRRRWFAHPYLIVPVALFAFAALTFLPAFVYSFPNGDDAAQHYWWSSEFVRAMGEGAVYPRWFSGAYEGRGSPVMFYYPPAPFYAFAAFYVLVGKPLLALALGCWLALALSGLTMYLFSRSLLSRGESLIAAGFYITAHYHLFGFYQRSAQHEFWAFAWVPLLLHGIYRVSAEDDWRGTPYVALGYCLLLMTHLPTSLIVSLVIPVYALLLTRRAWRLVRMAGALALGAGMASVFLLPYLLERGYLKPIGAKSPIQRYDAGFLLENLGSSFSQIPLPSSGNFYLFVSAGNWMLVGFVLLVAVSTWLIWNSEFKRNSLVRGIWAITALGILMTTRISSPVWKVIPKLNALQFPARWFVVVSFGASLLVAVAVSLVARSRKPLSYQACALWAVVIFNLGFSVLVMARAPFQPEALQKRLTYYTDVREYHPRWWDQQRHTELDRAPAVVDTGSATIRAIDETGTSQSYTVNANEESTLRLRTLYFPGWAARIDGAPAKVLPSKEGHIQLEIGPGEHKLELTLEDTPPRAAGKIISALSVVVFLVFLGIVSAYKSGKRIVLRFRDQLTACATGFHRRISLVPGRRQ